jgi:hypothetical protein
MHPLEMQRAARQGDPEICDSTSITTDRDALQASRIVRLYAVTFATAATIARLAYAVGAP